jgi:hypothetical protein
MTFTYETSDGNDAWLVAFRIEFGRRSHKVTVTARRKNGRRVLRMPEDRLHITKLLDFDMWPQFAQDAFSMGEGTTTERLFS